MSKHDLGLFNAAGAMPCRSTVIKTVTQSLAQFNCKLEDDGKLVRLDGSRIRHNHPFREWQYRLKRGERLPRGRYFRQKMPGRPVMVTDEFHWSANQNLFWEGSNASR